MSAPDDELARILRRSAEAATAGDTDLALARVQKTARIRHRRRVAIRGAAAVAAIGLVAGLWFAVRPSGDTRIDTVNSPTQPTPVTAVSPATTGGASSTSTNPTSATPARTIAPAPTVSSAPSTAPASRPGPSTSTPNAPSTSSAGQGPTTTAASTSPITFSGIGGRVTVRVESGSLHLLGATPSAGYVVQESKTGPTDIEVRFDRAGRETRIRVRLDHGVVTHEVSESGSSGSSGGGPSTTGSGSGGSGGSDSGSGSGSSGGSGSNGHGT